MTDWKLSEREAVRIYLRGRIFPAFGTRCVDQVGPRDVVEWFDTASADRPGAASHAHEILCTMLLGAEELGWCERGTDPCLGIRRNPRVPVVHCLDRD